MHFDRGVDSFDNGPFADESSLPLCLSGNGSFSLWSSGACTNRRVRSFSAVVSSSSSSLSLSAESPSLNESQHLMLSKHNRRYSSSSMLYSSGSRLSPLLSISSLAALDLAEPLPLASLMSAMRPRSHSHSPTNSVATPCSSDSDDGTAPLALSALIRDFRPSLPPLPECEEGLGELPHMSSTSGARGGLVHPPFSTPPVTLECITKSDSPSSSSVGEMETLRNLKSSEDGTRRRSLTTRILQKAANKLSGGYHTPRGDASLASTGASFTSSLPLNTDRKRSRGTSYELGVNTVE